MEVPIIRTIVLWSPYWGPLILGNYHVLQFPGALAAAFCREGMRRAVLSHRACHEPTHWAEKDQSFEQGCRLTKAGTPLFCNSPDPPATRFNTALLLNPPNVCSSPLFLSLCLSRCLSRSNIQERHIGALASAFPMHRSVVQHQSSSCCGLWKLA